LIRKLCRLSSRSRQVDRSNSRRNQYVYESDILTCQNQSKFQGKSRADRNY
jgi:hypothetical protein